MVTEALSLRVEERGLATITFDDRERKVNVLTFEMGQKLAAMLEVLAKREDLELVVLRSGKAGNFIAGADIREIEAIRDPDEGAAKSREAQRIPDLLEALPCPTLAVIDGVCLGGGLEIALGCTYRVATSSSKTRLGLPEVQLGFIPGMGGTCRLPRLVRLSKALDIVLTGKRIDAGRAFRMGLVDEAIPSGMEDQEIERVYSAIVAGANPYPRSNRRDRKSLIQEIGKVSAAELLLEETALGRKIIFSKARSSVLKETGGHYPAPLKAIEVMRANDGKPLVKALEREAKGFGELASADISKNLVRLFFMREKAMKGEGDPLIRRVGVLGAGAMGAGIAGLASWSDVPVRLKDVDTQALSKGLSYIHEDYRKAVLKKRLTKVQMEQKLDCITVSTDYSGFKILDLVIEAVVEDLEIKKKVYRDLEEILSPKAIVATNTSSLSLEDLSAELAYPERFLAMHFFNPVRVMPLVEVAATSKTDPEIFQRAVAFVKKLGKVPLRVKPCAGFLVNRLLMPYFNEAGFLLEEGAGVGEVDRALLRFGMPMGPFRLLDEVGIDIAFKAGAVLEKAYGQRMNVSLVLEQMYSHGILGKKGGLGFYRYEKGKWLDQVDSRVAHIINEVKKDKKITTRWKGESVAISERLILAMVNEAAYCLEEGVVANAEEVDLGMVLGAGFPPFRSGLIHYAKAIGGDKVIEKLRKLEEVYGNRFHPAPSLGELLHNRRS